MPPKEAGWLLAHRLLLTYLVGVVRQMAPQEAQAQVVADTLTMLEQSMPGMLQSLPPALRVEVEEAGVGELRRILRPEWRAR